jgi:hypothetical protein
VRRQCGGKGEVNWRWIARNWGLVGGTIIGLLFLFGGLYSFLSSLRFDRFIFGQIWMGVGVIFLALVAVNALKAAKKLRRDSN